MLFNLLCDRRSFECCFFESKFCIYNNARWLSAFYSMFVVLFFSNRGSRLKIEKHRIDEIKISLERGKHDN